jgi:hypothetical protein
MPLWTLQVDLNGSCLQAPATGNHPQDGDQNQCADLFLDLVAKQLDRFSRPHVLRFTVEQVTHVRKPFLVFASTGMLLGSQFIDPSILGDCNVDAVRSHNPELAKTPPCIPVTA